MGRQAEPHVKGMPEKGMMIKDKNGKEEVMCCIRDQFRYKTVKSHKTSITVKNKKMQD